MKAIAINGHKLHEIEMSLVPYSKGTISFLRYPKHRIQFSVEGNNLALKIPAFLAVELYRQAILPQEQTQSVFVKISGKEFGQFQVVDFRYGHGHDRELVSITFQKVKRRTNSSS
jgi:hypothetical protein